MGNNTIILADKKIDRKQLADELVGWTEDKAL
jgi:hypothetical protein